MKDSVLVVDDSPQNRMVAVGHLEAAGYSVTAVGSGEEALAHLAANRTDLVVLDILMPGMGGFEVCKRIRAIPELAGVPVMFLTALGDRETTQPALDAGADDLLHKPFHRIELLLRVRALIRLRRQAEALVAQNARLTQLEADKRRITELVVHDLKGPAMAILGNAEFLRDANRVPELDEMIADILTAVDHVDRTVHDLLDVSRAEDAALQPQLETLDLPALAAEVASTLRGFGRMSGVRITPDIHIDHLVADRELIRRTLQNLVDNAIRNSPARAEVRIDAVADGDAILLRVHDQGRGVPVADAERIFERNVSSERGHRGHGLGLAFCRLAAEAHGGTIWVEPHVPSGASFCVRLPQPR